MPKKQRAVFTIKPVWYKQYPEKILFLLIFGILFLLAPGQNVYTTELIMKPFSKSNVPVLLATPAPYPINKTGLTLGSDITAEGIIVYDMDSSVYLYKRNEDELLAPASTTKILTALVALDHYDLDDIVTVHTVMNNGAMMGLVSGERITVENLLYGALIQSGNDAAYALAEAYPGGVEKFVEAMNAKAKMLSLNKSSFTNPVGFDDINHKMTPGDLVRLGSIALNNKIIAKMVAIPQITVSDVTHSYFHVLKNVNQLLGKIPGVGGIKTGWTEEAGENLMTLIERDGHRLIIVVLRSADRFGETEKIINWVFSNYEWKDVRPTESIGD